MTSLPALGLPGDALTVIMVAAFEKHDLEAGPPIFYIFPDLISVVFAAMFFANLSILIIDLLETRTILYFLKIPFQFPVPPVACVALMVKPDKLHMRYERHQCQTSYATSPHPNV